MEIGDPGQHYTPVPQNECDSGYIFVNANFAQFVCGSQIDRKQSNTAPPQNAIIWRRSITSRYVTFAWFSHVCGNKNPLVMTTCLWIKIIKSYKIPKSQWFLFPGLPQCLLRFDEVVKSYKDSTHVTVNPSWIPREFHWQKPTILRVIPSFSINHWIGLLV